MSDKMCAIYVFVVAYTEFKLHFSISISHTNAHVT